MPEEAGRREVPKSGLLPSDAIAKRIRMYN
jgi:hypothetical protein